MADSSPLLSAEEKPELRHCDVFVIALPDHHDHAHDGPSPSRGTAAWRAVMVLAALALAGHCYRLHYYSPEVAARLWGGGWRWSAEGASSSSFLLPLYPKKAGAGDGVKASTPAVPERFVL
jgi:hypothetical protein